MIDPTLLAVSPATIAMPIVGNRDSKLNLRLEGVLRGVAAAYGALAAELWILDGESKELGLRSIWEQQSANAPSTRSLSMADADVAALAGGAVVLEHPADTLQWNTHRPAGAAVCLPVSSDRTIHGTLWLHWGEQQKLSDTEVEMIEIVAGRLAMEIECHALRAEIEPNESATPVQAAKQAGELQLANWSHPADEATFAETVALVDGRLLAMAGTAILAPTTTHNARQFAAEEARDALWSLAAECDSAAELLQLANEKLGLPDSGGEGISVCVALMNREGVGTLAAAGSCVSLHVRAAETLSHAYDTTPLGWDLEARYTNTPVELLIRQRLVLLAGTPQLTNPLVERRMADTFRAPTADAHRAMTAGECIARLTASGRDALTAAMALRRV